MTKKLTLSIPLFLFFIISCGDDGGITNAGGSSSEIDAAFAPSTCPEVTAPQLDVSYYAGPLTDTHFHMPVLSGGPSPGPQFPQLGLNTTVTEIDCTIRHEGTSKVFTFFSVPSDAPAQELELVRRTMQTYPAHFVPFINAHGNNSALPTATSSELSNILSMQPNLFQGYGEISLSERTPGVGDDVPPDDPVFDGIYQVVREHNLAVYFHPGPGQETNLANALRDNPGINFLVHGEGIENEVGALMTQYPNVYFTANDLYGDQYLLHPGETTASFLAALDDYGPLLTQDLATWKVLIETHPDQFLWGTDRGGIAVWTLDIEVGEKLVDYARAFIGQLDPSVQEKFAYRNAENLLN